MCVLLPNYKSKFPFLNKININNLQRVMNDGIWTSPITKTILEERRIQVEQAVLDLLFGGFYGRVLLLHDAAGPVGWEVLVKTFLRLNDSETVIKMQFTRGTFF